MEYAKKPIEMMNAQELRAHTTQLDAGLRQIEEKLWPGRGSILDQGAVDNGPKQPLDFGNHEHVQDGVSDQAHLLEDQTVHEEVDTRLRERAASWGRRLLGVFRSSDRDEEAHNHDHAHSHDDHGHHHEHGDEGAPITKAWKRLAVWGNAAVGVGQLVVGNVITPSVAGDGLHNAAEVAAYGDQSEAVLGEHTSSEQELFKRRKRSHTMLALGSAAVGLKAGVDLGLGTENDPHASSIYWSAASVALNGLLLGRLLKGTGGKIRETSAYVRDLYKHMFLVDMPSALFAFGGAALQSGAPKAEQAFAIGSGIVGTWAFRPTKNNLSQHSCLAHAHEEHGDDHGHERQTILDKATQARKDTKEIGVSNWLHWKVMSGLDRGTDAVKDTFTQETETGEKRFRWGRAAIAGLGSMALAGAGYYAMQRFGVSPKQSPLAGGNKAGSVLESADLPEFPEIEVPAKAPTPETPDFVEIQMPEWDPDTGRGSVWGELENMYPDKSNSEINDLKREALELNGLTGQTARHLRPNQRVLLPVA